MTELLDLTGIVVSLVRNKKSNGRAIFTLDGVASILSTYFQKEDSTDEERLVDKSEMNTEQIMIQVVVDMANEMKMLQIENGKCNLNPKDFTLNLLS